MKNLFEVEMIREKCGNCQHLQRWSCNSKVFMYCEITRSNRAENGLKKIMCKTVACSRFKSKKKNK